MWYKKNYARQTWRRIFQSGGSILTVSVFELIDRALDHLYTVNNVLPDTVDDEVTQELGNAIEVCEKIYNEFKPREVEE